MSFVLFAGVAKAVFMYYDNSMQYSSFAGLYDRLMSGVDYDAWAAYIARSIPKGASVLECACGTGQISLRLAAMGYKVTATDISEDMLMIASENQRAMGLASSGLRFLKMDMRHISLPKKADCVIACCDGVNYLLGRDDVKRFFSSARDALKPGGELLFDVSSRYKLKNVLGSSTFAENGEQIAYLWQNCYDSETKLIRMELSFFEKVGELYRRCDETHIQRAHSVRELNSWLDECGFEARSFGFMKSEPPRDDDERIQFIAKKI